VIWISRRSSCVSTPAVSTSAVVPAHSIPPLPYSAVSTPYTTAARTKNAVRISNNLASMSFQGLNHFLNDPRVELP